MEWYALRDLTRANASRPAWKLLSEAGLNVYTPMAWALSVQKGVKKKVLKPMVHDLLFVRAERKDLEPWVAKTPTLQFRFKRGGAFGEAIVIADAEMQRFITATATDPNPRYFSPDELTPDMVGKKVTLLGGPLAGYSGNLLKIRGMRKKRLIVSIPGFLSAAVEVTPDFIKLEE